MVKLLRIKKQVSKKVAKTDKKTKNSQAKATKQKRTISLLYYKRLIRIFVVLSVLLLVGSGVAWLRHVMNDPTNVFWAAIENNLRTTGATRNIKQKDGIVSTEQYIQFVTGVPHLAQGVTEINQDSRPPINIITETIGTPYKDFVRYTKAETGQKSAQGGFEDFSSILNIWGVSGTEPSSGQTGGQFYADSILNIVPTANLNFNQRSAVMETMRSGVYSPNIRGVVMRLDDSRPTYSYSVQVNFQKYLIALKQVAQYIGLTQLDAINPDDYANRQPILIDITVDVWSRTVKSLALGPRNELFVSRGISNPGIDVPTSDLVPLSELQKRINVIDQEQ